MERALRLPVRVAPGIELDFPSIADGASYRVPQQTRQKRLQWDDGVDWTHGQHNLRFGGQVQHIGADFNLGVFQGGAIEFIQDFADFDHNNDGVTTDEDLLFAVTIRSGKPSESLIIPDANNNHFATYVQDDWQVSSRLTLNLGLRYDYYTPLSEVDHRIVKFDTEGDPAKATPLATRMATDDNTTASVVALLTPSAP